MKNVQKFLLTIAAIGLLVATPLAVQAKGVTQLAFLQTLIQVTGDQLGAGATTQDVIQWAQAKGMNPTGGWNPSATLSKNDLAQLLVQLLNLNPKKGGGDYVRTVLREGINLGDGEEVSVNTIANILGNPLSTLLPRLPGSPVKHGNNGLGNGEDPPPPGFLNPHNPHFGGGQNDGPGTSPGNPNPHNKP